MDKSLTAQADFTGPLGPPASQSLQNCRSPCLERLRGSASGEDIQAVCRAIVTHLA